MKLVDVESQFDGNRVTFFFTAETRVDFRALVRDLADTFKTRIELRQIGVRDHAKRTEVVVRAGSHSAARAFSRSSSLSPCAWRGIKAYP